MNEIKKYTENKRTNPFDIRKGSASVTILIMCSIIITIGFSMVYISKTDYVLAKKNYEWINDYYSIESLIDEDIAKVEGGLKKAENNSIENFLFTAESNLKLSSDFSYSYDATNNAYDLIFFIDYDMDIVRDAGIENKIGIEAEAIYNANYNDFSILSKTEVPPDFEYKGFGY